MVDLLEEVGGIGATIYLTIGNLGIFFVLIYITDLIGLIRNGYKKRYTRNMMDHCFQNLDRLGKVITSIREAKKNGNLEDTPRGFLITQKVVD